MRRPLLFASFGWGFVSGTRHDPVDGNSPARGTFSCLEHTSWCLLDRKIALASSPKEFSTTRFDYLIVGGGTAGLVLAARLSEDPRVQVGVIEAGSYVSPGSDPRFDLVSYYSAVFGDPAFDWGLKSKPQEGLNGRVIDETVYVLFLGNYNAIRTTELLAVEKYWAVRA